MQDKHIYEVEGADDWSGWAEHRAHFDGLADMLDAGPSVEPVELNEQGVVNLFNALMNEHEQALDELHAEALAELHAIATDEAETLPTEAVLDTGIDSETFAFGFHVVSVT